MNKKKFLMEGKFLPSICFIILLWLGAACDEDPGAKKFIAYKGPLEEAENVQVLFSEKAILKVKVNTAKQIKQPNEDKVFPKPVFIDFFDPTGQNVITTLRADSGRLDNQTGVYRVMGHVKVVNTQKQQQLFTDELTWNPLTKKVFTERKVVVESMLSGERMKGTGLDANQDFSLYSIRKPDGFFNAPGGMNN
ncbi:MAG: LPS export ABC transporter periplasmic protein LptC [Runella slithyformis]|nr:MAG: LPS export ABC transporter periplasmic protein LptC [Runella slithyformis]TAE93383.1 MAG: LPS export ABC transporter periplasmic protein LptC [Runella slithyformis]TAF26605.1 MAG: LPS export ABC transporter periplasmic protein LptC [Runella slithyformis]TAF45373.1 MAG: LPS export ABC transporter periplasmic protein LptC [Runella slithyformis]TAF79491.1 MAG: LPS export ABC transporter periplasmic protein LptC [Runella slithyformis]